MKHLIILIVLFLSTGLWAQDNEEVFLGVLETHDVSSVQIRWSPSTQDYWSEGIRKGWNIYRQKLDASGNPIAGEVLTKLNASPLKVDTTEMKIAVQADSTLGGAAFFIAPIEGLPSSLIEAAELEQGLDFAFVMSSVTAGLDYRIAELGKLYWKDTDVSSLFNYYYEIRLADNSKEFPPAKLIVDLNKSFKMPKPYAVDLKLKEYKAELNWRTDFRNYSYGYYDIYRAVDDINGEYVKINDLPFMGSFTEESAHTRTITHNDEVPELGHTYHYKVRGISLFGEEGPFSEIVSGKAVLAVHHQPIIEKADEPGDGSVVLEWSIHPEDKEAVSHYKVFRSMTPLVVGNSVSNNIVKHQYVYVDETAELSNYYRVAAYDAAGDSTISQAFTVILEDSIPPVIPSELEGVADTNGLVHLKWKANPEADIKGYRVYRRNAEGEDFQRMVSDVITDTFYVDTISLRLSYKHIRYKVHAVDKRFNVSDPSEELKVDRPDITPPMPPVWERFLAEDDGISLWWANDVLGSLNKQTLYRKGGRDLNFRPIKTFEGDEVLTKSYVDKDTQAKTLYTYYFQSEDSSGLKSKPSKPLSLKQPFQSVKDPITTLGSLVSKENQMIKLFWEYNVNGIEKFKIFRQTPSHGLKYYITVEGSKREYYDKSLRLNSEYKYAIMAIFKDGSKSKISEPITVKY